VNPAFDPWRSASAYFDVLAMTRAKPALLRARQQQRLEALLRAVSRGSALYRAWLGPLNGALPTLADLPVVRKGELMRRFDEWVCDPELDLQALRRFTADPQRVGDAYLGRYAVWESSGSSGEPGVFVHDAASLAVFDALEAARGPVTLLARDGARGWAAGERLAFVGAVGGHFASVASIERVRRLNPWFGAATRCFSFLQAHEALLAQLDEYRPTILATYPNLAWVLAAAQEEGRLHIAPRAVWTGGETLSPALRQGIGARFGCPVHDSYGASEFLALAFECRAGALHVNSDWGILESVDDRGAAVPPGEAGSTTLLTHLANRVQPLIRYDLGDRIRLAADPCPCGSHLPVVQVQGRIDDLLTLRARDGHAVPLVPLALTTVLEEGAGVFDFELVQTGPARLRLNLCDAGERAGHAATVLRAFLSHQGLPDVRVECRAQMAPNRGRSGKHPRVRCAFAAA
jgi:phenylacetate-coenzyme A ligase PaaK-like adenylate-forming protein